MYEVSSVVGTGTTLEKVSNNHSGTCINIYYHNTTIFEINKFSILVYYFILDLGGGGIHKNSVKLFGNSDISHI